MVPVVLEITNNDDWRTPLNNYIKKRKLPTNEMEKMKVKHKETFFVTFKGSLYKKMSIGSPLHLFVTVEEGTSILEITTLPAHATNASNTRTYKGNPS